MARVKDYFYDEIEEQREQQEAWLDAQADANPDNEYI